MSNIYFLDNNNAWSSTDNSAMIQVEEMLQRMLTWRGEKSFDSNDGVDYFGVLNKQTFLKPQLEDIADQYAQYFDTTITDATAVNAENIEIKVQIVLKSGQTIARTLYP